MKIRNHLRSLYCLPLKRALFVLLLAVAFLLLLYGALRFCAAERNYREAQKQHESVLAVEESEIAEPVDARYNFFLLTDVTNPGRTWDRFYYEEYHQKSLNKETVDAVAALPFISRVERRYMTAGVSRDYLRLDTDQSFFAYNSRLILEGTLEKLEELNTVNPGSYQSKITFDKDASAKLVLTDVELLAGDPEQLQHQQNIEVDLRTLKEEMRDTYLLYADSAGWSRRFATMALDLNLFRENYEALQPGHRYIFVLRGVNAWSESAFLIGDDTRVDWWPYITDVTDLPENWLETEDFAPLRELIRVTEDDLHTFDVVYGDDMAAIPRVAEGCLVCMQGRFLTPADAEKPYCVVSSDLLETYGLAVGDTLTLELGNYLCEQYAPLGAVASTKGRHSTAFVSQEFTIIGAYLDLYEGKHESRDLYWCWSNNAIFVPTAFLPKCVNEETFTPKPSEVSFVLGNAKDIHSFMAESLPKVEGLGLAYTFSDGGWLQVEDELLKTRNLALARLLILSAAAILLLILSIWLNTKKERNRS